MLTGLALIVAGVSTGIALDWQLLDRVATQDGLVRRSAPAILIVPILLVLGVASMILGAVVVRLPVDRSGS